MARSEIEKLRYYLGLVEQVDTLIHRLAATTKEFHKMDAVGTINDDLVDRALDALSYIPTTDDRVVWEYTDKGVQSAIQANLMTSEAQSSVALDGETQTLEGDDDYAPEDLIPTDEADVRTPLKKHGVYVKKAKDMGWTVTENSNGAAVVRRNKDGKCILAKNWVATARAVKDYLNASGGIASSSDLRDYLAKVGTRKNHILQWSTASLLIEYINAKHLTGGFQGTRYVVLEGHEDKVPQKSGREWSPDEGRVYGALGNKKQGRRSGNGGETRKQVKRIDLRPDDSVIFNHVRAVGEVSTAKLMEVSGLNWINAREVLDRLKTIGVLKKSQKGGISLYRPAENVVVATS